MTTKPEMETIIAWTGVDERASVYSLMPRIWRQCLAAGGQEINIQEGIRDGRVEARTFLVPIRAIAIKKARQYSAAQQEKMRAKGRALAAAKMGLAPKEH